MLWGGRVLNPLTPIGVAMLGTAVALMPGGVLVPANRDSHYRNCGGARLTCFIIRRSV